MIKLNVGGWSFSVLASFFLSIFASFSERRKGHPLDDHDDVVDNVVVRLHSQRKETYLRDILEDLKIGPPLLVPKLVNSNRHYMSKTALRYLPPQEDVHDFR